MKCGPCKLIRLPGHPNLNLNLNLIKYNKYKIIRLEIPMYSDLSANILNIKFQSANLSAKVQNMKCKLPIVL